MADDTPARTESAKEKEETSPPAEPATTEKPKEEEQVTLPKKEVENLKAEVKQQQDLQSQADKRAKAAEEKARESEREKTRILREAGRDKESFDAPASRIPEEVEHLTAEKAISQLVLSTPQYQKALGADPTLRKILAENPLALVKDFFSVEDSVAQIKEQLDSRLADLDLKAKEEEKLAKKEKMKEEIPASPNPPDESLLKKEEKKGQFGEDKIAESIKGKLGPVPPL